MSSASVSKTLQRTIRVGRLRGVGLNVLPRGGMPSSSAFVQLSSFVLLNVFLCMASIPVTRFVQELPVWERRIDAVVARETRQALLAQLLAAGDAPADADVASEERGG